MGVASPKFSKSDRKPKKTKHCTIPLATPEARPDPIGESEPKPGDARFYFFLFSVLLNFLFQKLSQPESPARPEWRIRTGAWFTPTFSFFLSKHFINLSSCGNGFSFGQAHNHLQNSKQFGRPININKIHLQGKAFYVLFKMIYKNQVSRFNPFCLQNITCSKDDIQNYGVYTYTPYSLYDFVLHNLGLLLFAYSIPAHR